MKIFPLNLINIANAAGADNLIAQIKTEILNPIIGLMFAIAGAYFIYGAIQFIATVGNDTKREEGKKHMIFGLLGLFVMVSVFGIMNVIVSWIQN